MSVNTEAFRGRIRGTVIGIPAPAGADGGQRFLVSIDTESAEWADLREAHHNEGHDFKRRMTCIVNWPSGGTQPRPGDDVEFHASVRAHPRTFDFLVADITPTTDPRSRLESIMRAAAVGMSVSIPTAAALFPGLSMLAAGPPRVIRIRGPGVTDPYVYRAYDSLLKGLPSQAAVMFVQPGALPLNSVIDRARGMIYRPPIGMGAYPLVGGNLAWINKRLTDYSPGGDFRRAAPAGLKSINFMSRPNPDAPSDPHAYIIHEGSHYDSFALVMPYSPELTPVATWPGFSGLNASWAPKEVNSSSAFADLTARHETAHAAASPFFRSQKKGQRKDVVLAFHREECYADAAALISYLQDGGDPVQARIFARARHLSALHPGAFHCTGMACDTAIEEGLRLREFVARGGVKASPYTLLNKAIKIADTASHPAILDHNEAMADVLLGLSANAGRDDVLAAGLAAAQQIINPAARNASLEMMRGVRMALNGVWTPYELLDVRNARAAARVREASLSDSLEFLNRMGMPHLERQTRRIHNRMFRKPPSISLMGVLNRQVGTSVRHVARFFKKFVISSGKSDDIRPTKTGASLPQWLAAQPWSFMLPFVRNNPELVYLAALARVGSVTNSVPSAPPAEMLRPAPYVMGEHLPPGWWSGLATDPEMANMSVHGLLNRCVLRMREAAEGIRNSDITRVGEAWKGFNVAVNMLLTDPVFCDAGDAYVGRVSMDSLIALSGGPVLDERTPAADRDGLASKATRLSGAMSAFLDDRLLVAVARHEIWAAALSLPEAERMDMTNADFRGRDLSGRCLDGARLTEPDFSGAILYGFTMCDAEVSGGRFRNTQMFTNTDLRGTNPDGMNLDSVRGGPPMTDARSEPSDDHELSADFAQNSGQTNPLPSASRRF